MITEQDLKDQCEQIQNDLFCILDGIEDDDKILDTICQMVVERFGILRKQLTGKNKKTG